MLELSEEFKVAITDTLQYFRVNALQTKKIEISAKKETIKKNQRFLRTAKNKY